MHGIGYVLEHLIDIYLKYNNFYVNCFNPSNVEENLVWCSLCPLLVGRVCKCLQGLLENCSVSLI
jgi:hypothetical protein